MNRPRQLFVLAGDEEVARLVDEEFPVDWLTARAAADAEARAVDLLAVLRPHLPAGDLVLRDLGCGTGSMARWLAGWLAEHLPGRHRWILTDRDPALLAVATAGLPLAGTDQRDLTTLTADDLAGTSLVVGSALLDLFTDAEVTDVAAACTAAGVPALFALSVVGQVEFSPADPRDADLLAAFNAHQRRVVAGRRLLGPDAVDAATRAFTARGATVHRRPSPWRLGPARAALVTRWLAGWLAAAVDQRPDLTAAADAYRARRLAELAAGELFVTVHHEDLLALPAPPRRP